MVRELRISDGIEFTIECLPEDQELRGNVIASDNENADRAYEDEIIARLDRGDVWAWCTVKVTAEWRGYKGAAYLGGCTYTNERDFTENNSDYYDDMKREALDSLNASIRSIVADLAPLMAS
jgi:hypothetical protein